MLYAVELAWRGEEDGERVPAGHQQDGPGHYQYHPVYPLGIVMAESKLAPANLCWTTTRRSS